MAQNKHLSVKQVAERFGVSVATIWRWSRDGVIPAPVRISTGCTRWRLNDLESWEEQRIGGAA